MAGARRLDNEVRVGLDQQGAAVSTHANTDQIDAKLVDPLDVVTFGKTARRHVREFGVLFALIGTAIGSYQVYRGNSGLAWLGAAGIFALLGLFAPRALFPVWKAWMKFAHYLSIVMTGVILGLTWCLAFVPMAFILRVVGVKRMDRSFKDGAESYWETRDTKYDDFKRIELQY